MNAEYTLRSHESGEPRGCYHCGVQVPLGDFNSGVPSKPVLFCELCASTHLGNAYGRQHFQQLGQSELAQTAHWLAKQMHRPSIEKVFIVINGECNEGGNVVGVCSTKEKAIEMALKHPAHFEGGWVQAPEGRNTWFNKCDFIAVEEHDIL